MRARRIAAISVVLALCLGVSHFADVASPGETGAQKIVIVKYRLTPVDVGHPRFESADTSRSSFVTGAWYDASNSYMIIGLGGVNYHYCRMRTTEWNAFRAARSLGSHYNAQIKGRFDCRLGGMPNYDK
jgi:hypothetical protein